MAQRTRTDLKNRYSTIKNNLTADGKVSADELIDVLNDTADSTHVVLTDTYPSGGGGGGSSALTVDRAIMPIEQGLPLVCLGNSITGHQYYTIYLSDYTNATSRTIYFNAGESTRGNILRINQQNILPVNRTFNVSWMNGINDIRFNNSTTNYKWRHVEHVREFLVNAFAQSIETAAAASGAGRTYIGPGGGSWTTWGKGLANNGRSQGLRGTGDVAIDFLIPAGVESMAIVFHTNYPGEATENFSSSVRIEVEGQFVENINLRERSTAGALDHYTYHLPRTFFETSGGSQIRAINLDTSRSMVVDYGVALRASKDCPAAVVWDNSYVADALMVAGFMEGGNEVPTGITRAWWDECDQAVRDMIADNFTFYGYKVIMPETNRYFEPADFTYTPGFTDLTSATTWDGLHPNFLGHRRMFKGFQIAAIPV